MIYCTWCNDHIDKGISSINAINDEPFCDDCFNKAEARFQLILDLGR